jgi:hypothetical protein
VAEVQGEPSITLPEFVTGARTDLVDLRAKAAPGRTLITIATILSGPRSG